MRIAALVPIDFQTDLRRVLWTGHSLAVAPSADALVALVRSGECHLSMVDPTGIRDDVFVTLLTAIANSGIALVIWSRPNAVTCERILQAAAMFPTMVLLRDIDDDAADLQAMLRAGGATTAAALLHHRLANALATLPSDLRARCSSMFNRISIPSAVEELAAGTRWHARTVRRHFAVAGLGTPGRFLRVMRVVRTWELLRAREASVSAVAKLCGFPSEKALRTQFALCVGAPPHRAIRDLERDSFVEQLVAALARSSSD